MAFINGKGAKYYCRGYDPETIEKQYSIYLAIMRRVVSRPVSKAEKFSCRVYQVKKWKQTQKIARVISILN